MLKNIKHVTKKLTFTKLWASFVVKKIDFSVKSIIFIKKSKKKKKNCSFFEKVYAKSVDFWDFTQKLAKILKLYS